MEFEDTFKDHEVEMALFDMKDINRENKKIEIKDTKLEKERKKTAS